MSFSHPPSVKTELHIARSRCLSPCCRDVLRDVGSRDQDLRQRNRVIREEKDGQDAFHVRISVNNTPDVDYQTDCELGSVVAWCCFPGEKNDSGDDLFALGRCKGFYGEISL